MIDWNRKVKIPVMLFPGDYCLICVDPAHPGTECYFLELHPQPDGKVAAIKCGCDNSVTADSPGRYVVRVTSLQRE